MEMKDRLKRHRRRELTKFRKCYASQSFAKNFYAFLIGNHLLQKPKKANNGDRFIEFKDEKLVSSVTQRYAASTDSYVGLAVQDNRQMWEEKA